MNSYFVNRQSAVVNNMIYTIYIDQYLQKINTEKNITRLILDRYEHYGIFNHPNLRVL